MNRIVRERDPVSKLPEELQKEFPGQDEVTLTVETRAPDKDDREGPEPPYGWGQFSRFRHLAKPRYKSMEEIVSQVRAIRDEWDERDRLIDSGRSLARSTLTRTPSLPLSSTLERPSHMSGRF